jgi:putative polyketide hydroxylase
VGLPGHGWVLLAAGPQWRAAAHEASARIGVGISCREAGTDFADPENPFAVRYGLEPGGPSLIRPHGIVGWRAKTAPQDPASRLSGVPTDLLSR